MTGPRFSSPRPPSPARVLSNQFKRLPQWLKQALGLEAEQLPHRLLIPDVAPVVDINWPVLRIVVVPDPAPGNDIATQAVPAGVEWEVLSFSFRLIAGAAVANREVQFQVRHFIDNSTTNTGPVIATNALITAGQIHQVAFAAVGVVGQLSAIGSPVGSIVAPMPVGLRLHTGDLIGTATVNIQAADEITLGRLAVREWPATG